VGTETAGAERTTYVVVDGENIDATLGASILDGRPAPEQRPRWERLLDFARTTFQQPAKGLFFLNASSGHLPMSFVQALLALGYQPIPLAGGRDEKVVDIGIQRTLDALVEREGDVLLGSHDVDFLPQIDRLLTGDRLVGLVGFKEFMNSQYAGLHERGLKVFDLEEDVRAFKVVLPRVRIIPLAEFDPTRYL
jgi:putative heme uptake system protein